MYENIATAKINKAVNGIELSFNGKPDYSVLKDLKENGFRWHYKKQIWYGRNTAANVRAVEKYVDLDASDASFGITPGGTVDVQALRNQRLGLDVIVPEGAGEGADAVSREGSEVAYDLGFGHLGNGVTVWNRLAEEYGDYKTVAHISPERAVTYYDKAMPESVKQQIREFAERSTMTVSATQEQPVFHTPSKELVKEPTSVENPVKQSDAVEGHGVKPACLADIYETVGRGEICRDSTVEGSLWSPVSGRGYYSDINACVYCNREAAYVVELDNAMKRGKECKCYSIYANGQDIHLYLLNECNVRTPKDLYDLVRSGKELPAPGRLSVREEKGVEVFSPFVSVKPLKEAPTKWKKGDLVKAIMSGQVFSGVLDQRLTDDYAYDAAVNFGSGRQIDLPGQAFDLVEGCRNCYIRSDGVDVNGVVSVHFSYAGEMMTFLFDVNCDLAEGVRRREAAAKELEQHNAELRAAVKAVKESDIDPAKLYVIDKIVEDSNTGKLGIKPEVVQGFALIDRLGLDEITDLREAELIPNRLYQVADFFHRRDYAEDDARIIDTGNWGQVCSGKAIEELTRESVSLYLTMVDLERPLTFEAAKKDCMQFISGQSRFLFGNQVDYSQSLQKLEAEEVRVARDKSAKRELGSLSDIIGFAEIKKEFEKNQSNSRAPGLDLGSERDFR